MDSKQRKIYDEQTFLEYTNRKEKADIEKKKKQELHQRLLLNPIIKNNLLRWVDKYKNGKVYEGYFCKEKCFEINRGLFSFSLKIIHKELKSEKKSFSSIYLIKLQESANKVLNNNPEFLRKFKTIS